MMKSILVFHILLTTCFSLYFNQLKTYEGGHNFGFKSILYDANGFCFVGLSHDDQLITSRKYIPPHLEDSSNTYSDFKAIFDFSAYLRENPVVYDKTEFITEFTKAPDSIIVATSSRLIEVIMDFQCSELVSIENRIDPSKSLVWGQVYSMAASDWSVWYGTEKGLFVSYYTGSEGFWKTYSMDNLIVTPTLICTSLSFVAAWNNSLFCGTSETFLEIQYGSNTSPDIYLNNFDLPVYQEWIGSVIALPILKYSIFYDCGQDVLWMLDASTLYYRRRSSYTIYSVTYLKGAITSNFTSISSACVFSDHSFLGAGTKTPPPSSLCYLYLGTRSHGVVRLAYTTVLDQVHGSWTDAVTLSGFRYMPRPQGSGAYDEARANTVTVLSDRDMTTETCSCDPRTDGSSTTIAFTDYGYSFISSTHLQLQQKEVFFSSLTLTERHVRGGNMMSNILLQKYGDLNNYYYSALESDGLYTSQYSIAMSLKCYVAQLNNKDACQHALNMFNGVRNLVAVTGVTGLVASTYCTKAEILESDNSSHPTLGCGTDEDSVGEWQVSTTLGGWVWKSNPSSVSILSYLLATSMAFDLLPFASSERLKVLSLITDVMDYIIRNDYYYVDISGSCTADGVWNAKELNGNSKYKLIRGINGMQILSMLAISFSITGDLKYYYEYIKMGEEFNYFRNIQNLKINSNGRDNHKDTFAIAISFQLLYYSKYRLSHGLVKLCKQGMKRTGVEDVVDCNRREALLSQEMLPPVDTSLMVFWNEVRGEKSPFWLAIVSGFAEKKEMVTLQDVRNAMDTLRYAPLDLVNWQVSNYGRWDVEVQPYSDYGDATAKLAREVMTPLERPLFHWDSNPYLMQGSESDTEKLGYQEYAPTEWLYSYWILRFHDISDITMK